MDKPLHTNGISADGVSDPPTPATEANGVLETAKSAVSAVVNGVKDVAVTN
jgi:hypothetical protein